ncbi:Cullin-associated NEDD8-dissociated protein 1 [Phlyctochytrium planicorne]|nr:Cullin-associated NEDD8-dissociated protein 1 [Phlyctochytrium planicorne]
MQALQTPPTSYLPPSRQLIGYKNSIKQLNNADSDFRYMALADLNTELQKDTNVLEDSSEKKIVAAVVKSLDDKNGEVQNQAVKILGPLVKKVREPQLQEIVDQLCNLLTEPKDELRDISAIGLKTVIAEIPANSVSTTNLVKRLVPKLNALLVVGTSVPSKPYPPESLTSPLPK